MDYVFRTLYIDTLRIKLIFYEVNRVNIRMKFTWLAIPFLVAAISSPVSASINPEKTLENTPLLKFHFDSNKINDYQRVINAMTSKADAVNAKTQYTVVTLYSDKGPNSQANLTKMIAKENGQLITNMLSKSGISEDRISIVIKKQLSDTPNTVEIFITPQ